MEASKCNIVLMGVSFFFGMAGSMRLRNVFVTLIEKDIINVPDEFGCTGH